MLKELYKLVENDCKKETNYYTYSAWTHHILPTIKYGKLLAKELKADIEIVELATLFHDYACISNKEWTNNHHIKSAQLAEEILSNHQFPKDKITQVKYCIETHRASLDLPRKTIEAQILASADAMAHFDVIYQLLNLAYVIHQMEIEKGRAWVLAKLERSFKKLMPEAQRLVKIKYDAAQIILKDEFSSNG